ncbi:MAG: transcriptional regulator [Verrucomicrobia bacterium]|nr:MAG: transcriptional regulator [Verrucomicrobiota bacterium]PYK00148.1 MAG: transcriptional regulator [Verrucomicrobiota bacterium]
MSPRQRWLRVARKQAKATLKRRGWSYRRVAPVLGVSFTHLAKVLTGRRSSNRLLAEIKKLPRAET